MSEISEIVDGLIKRGKVNYENLEPVTIRIPKETMQRIDRLSKVLGESKAALMRVFLESAIIEAENHLNKIQGTPKGRKLGGRSAKRRKPPVQGRTATGQRGQGVEGLQESERGRGIDIDES